MAFIGPLFVIVIVNIMLSPTFGAVLLTDFVNERSACGVGVKVGVLVGVDVLVEVGVYVGVLVGVGESVAVGV